MASDASAQQLRARIQELESTIAWMRTRVEASALKQRASDIRADRRGRLLETLLQEINGDVFHNLSIQLGKDEELADVLTDDAEHILDYFTVPLQDLARAAATSARCKELLQERSPVWLALAMAHVQESGYMSQEPEKDPPDQGNHKEEPSQSVDSPTPAQSEANSGSTSSVPKSKEDDRSDAATPAPISDMSDGSREIVELVGAGEILAHQIVEQLVAAREATADDSGRRLYERIDALESAGLIEKHKIELSIAKHLYKGIGQVMIGLTDAGKACYRDLSEAEPVDGIRLFECKYKTLEAGLLIRIARKVLENWNEREGNQWTCDVVDTIWDSDEALALVPGAKRAYSTPDGSRKSLPDLVLQMHPAAGGTSQLVIVEVERGGYTTAELRDKWQRAILSYPPAMIYVVTSNKKAIGRLYTEWRTVVNRMVKRRELPHKVCAAFYTLHDLDEFGPLSCSQFVSLMYASQRNEERKEAGEKLSKEEERLFRLPRFWNQTKLA
jgi:hypothetical protein